MFLLWILVAFFASALGGTICPSRKEIYPCSCINVHIHRRNILTIVSCHKVEKAELVSIFPALRAIEIDRFYLYDSFWRANMLGAAGESDKVLPADWITLLNIKEIDIIDSALSSCFACDWNIPCMNTVTTSFKIMNSSSSDRVCSLCDNGRGNKSPWTGCMTNLKEFHFNYGTLVSFGVDFFPMAMRELITLNLSYNHIGKVDSNVLKNLPKLKTLDLSYNAIEFFDHMFTGQETSIEFLDISSNFVKTLGTSLFTSLPSLKTFNAVKNGISDIKHSDWVKAPKSLKNINFSENPFRCDCNLKWFNSTFHINVVFEGTCSSPSEYEGSQIRRAARFLLERCDSAGRIGTRKPKPKSPKRKQ